MRSKLALFWLLSLMLVSGVSAQGGSLSYGANVIGTLSAQAPLAFFTFSGSAGDLVTVDIIGITPGLDPAVSLNSPTQQQLASNDNNPGSAVPSDARISLSLPQNGIYTILVNSVSGVMGDFLVRLNGQAAAQGTALGDPASTTTLTNGMQRVFSFDADPEAPVTLSVSSESPGLSFQVTLRTADGQIVALLGGSAVSLNLPPGQQTYTVTVLGLEGSGQVSVSAGRPTPPPTPIPSPVPTDAVTATPSPTATLEASPTPLTTCMVASNGVVNVRSGPGTNYDIIRQIRPEDAYVVTGLYLNWYLIDLDGTLGWARNDVVSSFGPCDAIPPVDTSGQPAPATMTVPPPVETQEVEVETESATPTVQQALPTFAPQLPAPSATPLPSATSTFTPTATPQLAPEDARFNDPLTIPLDHSASVSNFVSYPDGDNEDRINWDIDGMNPTSSLSGGRARLVIAASCFGQNIDQIRFSTGGRTFTCGETIVNQEVNYDSRTGSVVITAVGGEGTYVQWTLTGTATRVN